MVYGPKIITKTVDVFHIGSYTDIDAVINKLMEYKQKYENVSLYYIGDGETEVSSSVLETEEEYQYRLEEEKCVDAYICKHELEEYARLKAKYGDIQ